MAAAAPRPNFVLVETDTSAGAVDRMLQMQAEMAPASPITRWSVSGSSKSADSCVVRFSAKVYRGGEMLERKVVATLPAAEACEDGEWSEAALLEALSGAPGFGDLAALSAASPFLGNVPNISLAVMGSEGDCAAWLDGAGGEAGGGGEVGVDDRRFMCPMSADVLTRLYLRASEARRGADALDPVYCADGGFVGEDGNDDDVAALRAMVHQARAVDLAPQFRVRVHRSLDDLFGAYMSWRGPVQSALQDHPTQSKLGFSLGSAKWGATHWVVRVILSADRSSMTIDLPGGWRHLGDDADASTERAVASAFGGSGPREDGCELVPIIPATEEPMYIRGVVNGELTGKGIVPYAVNRSSPEGSPPGA